MVCETEAKARSASPADGISKTESLCLAAILLLFLVASLHSAYVRPFWFDELSTFFVASTPTIGGMFKAIPTDGNPPLYFVLARLFLHLPLKPEVALRLPAIFAYLGASLTVYHFVRRDTCRLFAFLAVSLFLGCSFHTFAIEARAYSLLLAFTGLAIVSWQSYCITGTRRALAGISLSIAGAILTHQYGLIYATLPLVVGEVVRSLRRSAIDLRVLCAVLIPIPLLGLTYPVTLRAQEPLLAAIRACPVFTGHPRLADLKDYAWTLPPLVLGFVVLTLILLLLKIALSRESAEPTLAGIPIEDFAVAVALSCLLPAMLIATHFGTNYFMFRYGIGSSLGVSILFSFLLARLPWRYAANIAWAGVVYSLCLALLGIWAAPDAEGTRPWLDPVLRAGDPSEPIVVASALEYSPAWWYGGSLRGRMHYLEDLPYATLHSDTVPEYSLALEHAYTPMHMESYQEFVATHRQFLLYCYGETNLEWIKPRLLQEGWHLTLLASEKEKVHERLRADHRDMFLVSR